MNEIQLFYLTIMVGLCILYLIISKICETKQIIEKAKTISLFSNSDIRRIDFDNPEDMQEVMQEIDNMVNKSKEENNGRK